MGLSSQEIAARAARLKLLLFDVDGVLTDGTVTITGDGWEAKSFYIRDGAALVWARREGLQVGLLSGRASPATTRRAAELGLSIVVQGVTAKGLGFAEILDAHGIAAEEASYMGDDLMDLPALELAGLSAAPADAAEQVRRAVDWVSARPGGRGAVREFVELVLAARGRWPALEKTSG